MAKKAEGIILLPVARPGLFCFDFDKTMIKGHSHNVLAIQGHDKIMLKEGVIVNCDVGKENLNPRYDREKVMKLFGELLNDPDHNLKNPDELIATFHYLLGQGHKIAITSFTFYPHAIIKALEKFDLSPKELERMTIITGFPLGFTVSGGKTGKEQHIERAMQEYGITDKSKVVLIDDSLSNIQSARKNGFYAIAVDESPFASPEYLSKARGLGDQFLQEAGVSEGMLQIRDLYEVIGEGKFIPKNYEVKMPETKERSQFLASEQSGVDRAFSSLIIADPKGEAGLLAAGAHNLGDEREKDVVGLAPKEGQELI